jgi:SAM-dependent methyltransferase
MSRLKNLLHSITDHPVRHVVQNSLLALPGTKSIQSRMSTSTGANAKENYPEVMRGWAEQVIAAAKEGGIDVAGAKIAEVGPGHSLGVALNLLLAGASEVFACDVKRFADPSNVEPLRPIAECWKKHHPELKEMPDLKQTMSRLQYAIVRDDGSWPIADNSVDILFSYFAGEHLRAPAEVLAETQRVLRPGGVCMYAIDLRDHINRDRNWLQFLYYEPWLWEAMTSRRGQWSNRLLAPQWRKLFEEKFEIVKFDARTKEIPKTFNRNRLAAPFRPYSTEELSVDYVWAVGRKPQS